MVTAAAPAAAGRGRRIAAIDIARGVALAAMIVYHFAFDLRLNGLIAADVVGDFGWVLLARLTAGTFLFLVGVNLVLASRGGIRPRPFLRRLALVALGAALVSLGTWWFNPATFVFFGILHEIAVASVLAIPFLRRPAWWAAAVAAIVLPLPHLVAHPVFDLPALWWVGLSTMTPVTVDYVPIFPWFGVVLAGVAAGRWFVAYAADSGVARWQPGGRVGRFVMVAGQWSLLIYLIHQPILVGAIALATWFLPSAEAVARANFTAECLPACRSNDRDGATCAAFCGCMFTGLYGTDLYSVESVEMISPEQRQRWTGIVNQCAGSIAVAR